MCVYESSLYLAIDNLKEHSLYSSIMLTEVITEQVNLNFFLLKGLIWGKYDIAISDTLLACQELLASHCKVSEVTRP